MPDEETGSRGETYRRVERERERERERTERDDARMKECKSDSGGKAQARYFAAHPVWQTQPVPRHALTFTLIVCRVGIWYMLIILIIYCFKRPY